MTQKIWVSILLVSAMFISACNQNADVTKVQNPANPGGGQGGGGSGNPQQKPSPSPTPFDINQFQQGQWIMWSRKSSTGIQSCVRWVWAKVGTAVNIHTILGDYSPDCQNWPGDVMRTIKYSPTTGKVEIDRLDIDGSLTNTPNGLTSIYSHLYGSGAKVEFTESNWSLPGKKRLPVFSINGQNQIFLNKSGHPFHGVVLRWNEGEDNMSWTYQFVDSNPAMPFLD